MSPSTRDKSEHTQQRDAAVAIVRVLREAGHTAYLAGGCVRDELLGLPPSDYDVATDAIPARVISLFPRTEQVGAAFGVVLVKQKGFAVEVATFRSDGDYSDRRRPDTVRFGSPREDATRRDFTVNALFLDPFADPAPGDGPLPAGWSSGHVIDFVGGLADLQARLVRAVGDPDARFTEDHLRALRAVRLACRLGFALDDATAGAITRRAAELRGVSRERIGEEVRSMLAHPSRARAAGLLAQLGLERPVLDRADASLTLASREPRFLAGLAPDADAAVAIAAWMLDMGAASEPSAIERLVAHVRIALNLSNEDRELLRGALLGHLRLRSDWQGWAVAARKRFAASSAFAPALALVRATDGPRADGIEQAVETLSRGSGGLAPEPLLTGDDLVAMGWIPGKGFKAVLEAVYDAQLEGKIHSPEEARELASTLRV